LLLLTIFTYIYAVVGVECFAGVFKRCCKCDDLVDVVYRGWNGSTIHSREQCLNQNTFDAGISEGRRNRLCWDNPPYSFDNVLWSIQSLFEVMTTHGWVDIMESAMDATGKNLQPSRDANPVAAYYFITFQIVVTFFLLNMFVGGK
ncbi:ion transporter, partial [bacterium]|nr:ion transporter [bacterium]